MQRAVQKNSVTSVGQTANKQSRSKHKYNHSSFDIEQYRAKQMTRPSKDAKASKNCPGDRNEPATSRRNACTNYQTYDKQMKKTTTSAFVDMHSPRKLQNISTQRVSQAVSPAPTSYRAPLYSIQLEEGQSAAATNNQHAQIARPQNHNSIPRRSVNTSYSRDRSQNVSENRSGTSTFRKRTIKPVLDSSQLSHRVGLRTNPTSNQTSRAQLPDLGRAKGPKGTTSNAQNIKSNSNFASDFIKFKQQQIMDKHSFGNPVDMQTKMTATKLNKKRIKSSGKITVSGVTQSVTSFNGPAANNAYIEETPNHMRGHLQPASNESIGNEHLHFGGGYSSNAPSGSHVKAQTVYNHQRIQSNPVFLNEFNQMLANSQNQQLRMTKQQQAPGHGPPGHSNTVSIPSNSSKKMTQEKRNSNSHNPQPTMQKRGVPSNHHGHQLAHDGQADHMQSHGYGQQQPVNDPMAHYSQTNSLNQSNSGLNKAFSKVLNTLSNDNTNMSRQDAANHNILNAIPPKKSLNMMAMQQAKVQTIGATGGGHGGHQKALSMSSYMMQPKNMSFTQQQSSKRGGAVQTIGAANQNTAGTSMHVQPQGLTIQSSKMSKKKPLNSQQMTFVSDPHHVKTVMVQPTHQGLQQNRLDLYNQHSTASNANNMPVSKTQHQSSSNTLSITKTQQQMNQKFQKTSLAQISQLGKMGRGAKTTTKQTLSKNIITQKQQTSPRNSINISASISPQIKTTIGSKAQIGRTQQSSMMGQTQIQQTTSVQQSKLQTGHHRRQVTLQYEPSSQIQGGMMPQNATSFQNSAMKGNQTSSNNTNVIKQHQRTTQQRQNVSSANAQAQAAAGNHRRIRSDQVSMTKKSLNQHYLDNVQAQQHAHQAQQQQQPEGSQDVDHIANSSRIVVINNNNTNINIHHPNSYQNSHHHQYTADNIQSLQESYNLAGLNGQIVGNQMHPGQQQQQPQPAHLKAQTQHNSTMRTNSINLSQKNANPTGIQSVPSGYHAQISLEQSKNINQQINQLNHQRIQSMDLDIRDENFPATQQQQNFLFQQQQAVSSQKSQKRKLMQNQQQSKHVKKISGVPEQYKGANAEMIQLTQQPKHHQSKSLMQNLNLVSQQNMMQHEFDQSIGNNGIPQAVTDNVSSNAMNDGLSQANDHAGTRSQTRGDSSNVKRASMYSKSNTVKRGTSGNSKKNSLRQGVAVSHNNMGSAVMSTAGNVNNFIVQASNQSSKGNMRRTIKNPQTSGKQLMNHLKQNQGDKPSTLLNSDRSTKLGASQNNMNQSQGHTDEVIGYQSSSTTQMMQANQYRSGAMGGHMPVTQQQMFKNIAMSHGGAAAKQFQNNPSTMKQMSAHNLHALNNNSESQSQSQFEQVMGQYNNNAVRVTGQHRQRQNNYVNSQERPDVKVHHIQDMSGQNATKHKKVNSGQLSNSQMKLYQIMSNQQQIQQNNNFMAQNKGNNEALTPDKLQQSQQYAYMNSQKASKETVLTESQKYKVGAGKNPNFQSFHRQKSQYKDDSSSMNRSPRDSNQQSPFHSKGGTTYYANHGGGHGPSAYGQVIDPGNKRYADTQNSPIQQSKQISLKDPNLHKVQTKNRYAQSELLKKANNQKQMVKTEQSIHEPTENFKVSKMTKNTGSAHIQKRVEKRGPPGIVAKMNAEGGQLTPRKLILNGILTNIANKVYETKIDYYKVGKVIGKGAFGKVNLAINRLTGKFVALKSINKTYMTDESSLKKIMQEYNILKRARHQNIVRLYESFDTDSHTVYVMEVCGGGDLLTYVRRRRKLKEDLAKHVFSQLIRGLMYVHSKRVLHRDIKLDNILLTSEGDVKICDFGVSKLVQNKNQTQHEQCGTPAYIAPEVFRGKGYKGFQSDVWSAGVVLYAMLFGTVPFKATNMGELQQQIINVQCSWGQPGDISDGALSILKRILEADPNKRLTPQQILIDPWMQLTEQQISKIEVFTKHEKEKIVNDFEYYNQKKEDGKTGDDPFLEQKLQSTQNSIIKNNTTKSVILAPFNSTKSHISDTFYKRDSIQELLVSKSVLAFANKCKEINRQYMLNNNAELDNGVYNENEGNEAEDKQQNSPVNEKEAADDGLMGLNMQIDNKGPSAGAGLQHDIAPPSQIESNATSNLQSLNTSQIVIDSEKAQHIEDLFGYDLDYIIESVENEELNHCTTIYYLIDQEKEF